MRRLLVSVTVASGLVLTGAGTASAEQAPTGGAAQAAAGKKICKITDERLGELSGLVATDDGFVVVNDSSDQSSRNRVFFLDDKCKVVNDVSYSGDGPRDTEDMALSPDGETLWIADIGDNRKQRRTIALWSMPADGSKKPKIHRLAYPDGQHDAEALLMNGDGTPIIVTKEFGRAAALYTPTAELKTENTEGIPMRKVGEITVPPSDTSGNPLARIGRATIDGGATSRDGSKVVLRTYTDALEWPVSNGDVVAALKGAPLVTPLPDEPFGEAIAWSPDSRFLYTVSDMGEVQDDIENFILRYTPVTKAAVAKTAGGGAGGDREGPSWFDDLSINDLTYIVGGVGVLGAILVGLGVFGIVRSRKRPPADPAPAGAGGPEPANPETELIPVGGAPSGRGSGVYGGNRGGPAAGPGVYGAKPAAGSPKGGGVYGGQPAAGRPAGGRPVPPVSRPGGAGQPARPGGVAQPGRAGGVAQPGRTGGVVQPGRKGGVVQPGRSGGGRSVPPGDGASKQPGRPGQPGGGVYGPPPQHPQGPGRTNSAGSQSQRPSGFFGQGAGHQEPGRPAPSGMNSYADPRGRARGFDNPGYGRNPHSRH